MDFYLCIDCVLRLGEDSSKIIKSWRLPPLGNKKNIITGCITCNQNSPLSNASKFPIEVVVGPEFLTGSSRMKAGTAQKLVLNMITTTTMIQLGHVKGNKMIDMQLSNYKLVDRGIRMIMNELDIIQA